MLQGEGTGLKIDWFQIALNHGQRKKGFIKKPNSTRPWQHVFEAQEVLIFAAKLSKNKKLHGEIFNFGPGNKFSYSVLNLVNAMKENWNNVSWSIEKKNFESVHETNLLKLNCLKAKKILKWKSILSFKQTAHLTSNWYKYFYSKKQNIEDISILQLNYFNKLMKKKL